MKTYRADSGIDHRLSTYGERSMPQYSAGKAAVRPSGRGVLKRLAAATSRAERGISRACRSTSKT
ncbi:hypothetical protein ABC383_07470 [Noviherbaspirillum sp. 1P10PC]|uniref:hypothetical protein n=1 Tax=Noviherbaspirillum sp. 1P10PC TaxID=3132292 RepID=UPI0039A191C4